MSETLPEDPKLTCKSATIHFIYSFCLESKGGSFLIDLKSFIKEAEGGEYGVTEGKPESRSQITPHLNFKTLEGWSVLPDLEGSVDGEPIIIRRLLRIMSVGATCCISVELPKRDGHAFCKDDVMKVLKLIRQRDADAPNPLEVPGFSSGTIFSLFQFTVDKLLEASSFDRLEKKEKLIDLSPGTESQTPWVVTLLEVDEPVGKAFCSDFLNTENPLARKAEAIRPFMPEIAPILFRSIGESGLVLEPAYLPANGDNFGFFNMNLDARLFVTMSRRSVLCICSEKDKDPASYFMPGLLDLCEMVRVRWHMLAVMHRIVDESVRNMRATTGVRPARERLLEIIRFREWLATSLEDPGIYILAGDALSKLHEKLQMIFRLSELRESIIGKINLLDRLYADVLQSGWMDQLSASLQYPKTVE